VSCNSHYFTHVSAPKLTQIRPSMPEFKKVLEKVL
jgi:hypothetical protein